MKSQPLHPGITLDRFPDAIQLILDRLDELEEKLDKREPSANSVKPITTAELCDHLGLTEPTIIRMRKKNLIPWFSPGGRAVRYNLADVLKALEKKSK